AGAMEQDEQRERIPGLLRRQMKDGVSGAVQTQRALSVCGGYDVGSWTCQEPAGVWLSRFARSATGTLQDERREGAADGCPKVAPSDEFFHWNFLRTGDTTLSLHPANRRRQIVESGWLSAAAHRVRFNERYRVRTMGLAFRG